MPQFKCTFPYTYIISGKIFCFVNVVTVQLMSELWSFFFLSCLIIGIHYFFYAQLGVHQSSHGSKKVISTNRWNFINCKLHDPDMDVYSWIKSVRLTVIIRRQGRPFWIITQLVWVVIFKSADKCWPNNSVCTTANYCRVAKTKHQCSQ